MKNIKLLLLVLIIILLVTPVKAEITYMDYNENGFNFIENNQYEKAIEQLKLSLKLNSEYAVAYNNLGAAYYNIEEYDKAIENFKKVISLEENYVKAYVNLAACYFYKNKFYTAYRYYQKSKEIDSEYVKERLDNPDIEDKVKQISDNEYSEAMDIYLKEMKSLE